MMSVFIYKDEVNYGSLGLRAEGGFTTKGCEAALGDITVLYLVVAVVIQLQTFVKIHNFMH